MGHPSLVPSLNEDVHFVLCAFGRAGLAYVETDPAEGDATTVVQNLLHGQYERPLRVLALNADEGWSRDVSEADRNHVTMRCWQMLPNEHTVTQSPSCSKHDVGATVRTWQGENRGPFRPT
jgi:hypothetical protein